MRAILAVFTLVACNQVYGLHDVAEQDATAADFDEDGIADDVDNCIAAPNPQQLDQDGDGRGDACDLCPLTPTQFEHDEDNDHIGDRCDPCPVRPAFPMDADQDGVDDACDPDATMASHVVVFDPFVGVDGAWLAETVPWHDVGDRVAPMAPLQAGDALRRDDIHIAGKSWLVEIGISSTKPWDAQTHFAIELESSPGTVEMVCSVSCTGPNLCTVDNLSRQNTAISEPFTRMRLVSTDGAVSCLVGTNGTAAAVYGPLHTTTLALVTQPEEPLDYVYAVVSP